MKKLMLTLLAFVGMSLFSACDECDPPEDCALEPNSGPCQAAIPKWYFDKQEGKCKQFYWGGCGGVVPFDTEEECKACECED